MGIFRYIAPEIFAFFLAVLICLPWLRPCRVKWLIVSVCYIFVDALVTLTAPGIHGLAWNWSGKTASLVLAVIIFMILRLPSDQSALRWPQTRMEWRWTVLGVAVASAFAGVVNFVLRDHSSLSIEQLVYEGSLPGLAEEMVWRGVLFIFLARAYTPTNDVVNFAPAAVISTLIFGLGHGVSLDHGSPNFHWLPFCYATLLGAWLAFLRIRVKSMITLTVAHNASNLCGVLANALP